MAEQTIKTRIKLRYDTLANWTSADPTLAAGEIGVVAIPSDSSTTVQQVTKPAILFKVGDGETAWSSLPYASGLAADVYSWAKASTKPSYTKSEVGLGNVLNVASYAKTETYTKTEVDGLIAEIQGALEADTNTKYQLVQSGTTLKLQSKEIGGSWIDVESFNLATILANTFDAKGAASTAESNAKAYTDSEIAKVDAKIPTVPVQSVNAKTGAVVLKASDIANDSGDTLEDVSDSVSAHISSKANPHGVTASQVGAYTKAEVDALIPSVPVQSVNGQTGAVVLDGEDIGYVGNTISAASGQNINVAINATYTALTTHTGSKSNPHSVTAEQVGTYTKAQIDAKVKANADAIEALTNGTSTEEIDSVMELVEYVNNHGTEVQGMKEDISANEQAIGEIQARLDSNEEDIADIQAKPAMSITSANITDWNDAVTKEHTHSNKTVLDGITSTKVSNWDSASTNSHTHSNKSVLDGTTASFTTALNTKLSGIATGAQVNVIERVVINDLSGTIDGKTQRVTIPEASTSASGLMSKDDKSKLDGLSNYDDTELSESIAQTNENVSAIDTRVTTLEAKPGLTKTGTVTSVKIAVGTGLKVDNTNAITTSGTRTISIDEACIFVLDGGNAAGY